MSQSNWVKLVLGTTLAAVIGAAAARDYGPPGMHMLEDGRMADRLIEKLALDAVQADQLRSIQSAATEATREDRERLKTLHKQFRAQADDFDQGAAQKLADEVGEITARLVYAATSVRASAYDVLTEAQRAELEEIRAAHESRREARRQHWQKTVR